mmetsp:Transcript_61289/g.173151  ORF Transcript_61289/g.173151 Transcript_61289/m.173151 type:complete len:200 (+) Transcript_61289:651-1250(+)
MRLGQDIAGLVQQLLKLLRRLLRSRRRSLLHTVRGWNVLFERRGLVPVVSRREVLDRRLRLLRSLRGRHLFERHRRRGGVLPVRRRKVLFRARTAKAGSMRPAAPAPVRPAQPAPTPRLSRAPACSAQRAISRLPPPAYAASAVRAPPPPLAPPDAQCASRAPLRPPVPANARHAPTARTLRRRRALLARNALRVRTRT